MINLNRRILSVTKEGFSYCVNQMFVDAYAGQWSVGRTTAGLLGQTAAGTVAVRLGRVGQRLGFDPGDERFAHRVYEPATGPRDGSIAALRRRRRRGHRLGQLATQAAGATAAALSVVPEEVLGLVLQLLAQRVQQRRPRSQLKISKFKTQLSTTFNIV